MLIDRLCIILRIEVCAINKKMSFPERIKTEIINLRLDNFEKPLLCILMTVDFYSGNDK